MYANTFTGADPQNATVTNANGYVAVELYNPYPVPMVLTNWQLWLGQPQCKWRNLSKSYIYNHRHTCVFRYCHSQRRHHPNAGAEQYASKWW